MKHYKQHTSGFGTITVLIGAGILILITGVGLFIQRNMTQEESGKKTIKLFTKKTTPMPTAGSIEVDSNGKKVTVTADDATDSKLDTDTSNIDASVNVINQEASNIDAGLNDQMGDLSE